MASAPLETNKLLAAILTAGIVASGSGVISRIIYHPEQLEEPVYMVEMPEGEGEGEEGAPEGQPIGVLLAAADPAEGETAARQCAACHTFEEGGAAKIGPPLWGVVGRDIAAVQGFAYSDALAGLEGIWDYEALNQFLANPKGYAPGTKMAYAGLGRDEARADLIMYLHALSPEAPPLPEPEEAAPPEGEQGADAAPAEGEQAAAPAEAAQEQPAEQDGEAAAGQEVEPQQGGDQPPEPQPPAEAQPAQGEQPAAAPQAQQQTAATESRAQPAAEDEPAEAEQAAAQEPEGQQQQTAAAQPQADEAGTQPSAAGAEAGGAVAMLAQADAAAGERSSRMCLACHSVEADGPTKIGPPLWDVVGREIATIEGYTYSDALAQKDGTWDWAALDQFLANPRQYAPGTKMAFAGVRKEADRANVLAYLRSLSDEPQPLPGG